MIDVGCALDDGGPLSILLCAAHLMIHRGGYVLFAFLGHFSFPRSIDLNSDGNEMIGLIE